MTYRLHLPGDGPGWYLAPSAAEDDRTGSRLIRYHDGGDDWAPEVALESDDRLPFPRRLAATTRATTVLHLPPTEPLHRP